MLLEYLNKTATCLMSKADTRHRRALIEYTVRTEQPSLIHGTLTDCSWHIPVAHSASGIPDAQRTTPPTGALQFY